MKALDQILYWASTNCPSLYKEYLYETHEDTYGPHFNEELARKTVDEMYHHDGSTLHKGEHWTIEQVKGVIEKYKSYLADTINCWDVYVALHMWWHDLELNYKKHGIPETYLIEDALTWAFMDEDAAEGKIWRYFKH